MAFTPDGRCLLANSREENTSDRNTAAVYALRIWDTETGTLWHESDCGNIEIYPNVPGKNILVEYEDSDLQETRREENYIACFISSGNGRWLEVEDIKDLSSSGDGGYGEILYLSFPAMAFGSGHIL
jgi:hypothetical protein